MRRLIVSVLVLLIAMLVGNHLLTTSRLGGHEEAESKVKTNAEIQRGSSASPEAPGSSGSSTLRETSKIGASQQRSAPGIDAKPPEPSQRVQTEFALGYSFGRAVDSNDPKEGLAGLKVGLFCSLNSNASAKSFDDWFAWWTNTYGSALKSDPRPVNVETRLAARRDGAREIYDRCSDFFVRSTKDDAQKFQKMPAVREFAVISEEIRNRDVSKLPQTHPAFGSGTPALYDLLLTHAIDTLGFQSNGNEWADATTREFLRAKVLCGAGELCTASSFLALESCMRLAVCGQQRIDLELAVALSQAKVDPQKFEPFVALLNAWVRGEIPWSELQTKMTAINLNTKG